MIGIIIGVLVPAAIVYLAGWGPLSAALTTPTVPPPPPPARPPAGPLPRRIPPGRPPGYAHAYWEARARATAGMNSGHPERLVYFLPNPQDFAALETLLADEQSLHDAAAAEHDARHRR